MRTVNVTASVLATFDEIKISESNISNRYNHVRLIRNYESFISDPSYHKMPQEFSMIISALSGAGTRVKMSMEITQPGIVEVPNLYENSEKLFRYVFFPEAGSYSLVKIYKFMRSEQANIWKDRGILFDQIPDYLNKVNIKGLNDLDISKKSGSGRNFET